METERYPLLKKQDWRAIRYLLFESQSVERLLSGGFIADTEH